MLPFGGKLTRSWTFRNEDLDIMQPIRKCALFLSFRFLRLVRNLAVSSGNAD